MKNTAKRLEFYHLFVLSALMVSLDQFVKRWVVENLKPVGEMEFLTPFMRLIYVENRGAAFGMFENARWIFICITFIAVIGIIVVMCKKMFPDFLAALSLSLILGGAVGNLIDRVFSGYVVDFFEFCFVNFAVFNVADIFVVIGGIMLCIYLLFFEKKLKANASQHE